MDEDMNPEAENAGGGLNAIFGDGSAPQGGNPANLNEMFRVLRSRQAAGIARREATAADQYAAAQKRLEQRYEGPSTSDMLMKLSQAMLSQRRTPGFAGALGQVVGSLNETNDAARAAQLKREDMLAELQSQYSTGQMTREAAGDRSAAELFKIYSAMNKPLPPVRGIDVAGRLTNPVTGEEIGSPVELPSPEAINYLRKNPNLAKEFDEQFGAGTSARVLRGL